MFRKRNASPPTKKPWEERPSPKRKRRKTAKRRDSTSFIERIATLLAVVHGWLDARIEKHQRIVVLFFALGITWLALHPPVKSMILAHSGDMYAAEVVEVRDTLAMAGSIHSVVKIRAGDMEETVSVRGDLMLPGDQTNYYHYSNEFFHLSQTTHDEEGAWWIMYYTLGSIPLVIGYIVVLGLFFLMVTGGLILLAEQVTSALKHRYR